MRKTNNLIFLTHYLVPHLNLSLGNLFILVEFQDKFEIAGATIVINSIISLFLLRKYQKNL